MSFVARIGDASSHGGVIITGSSEVTADGIPVARTGDLHSCPIEGHGITPMYSSSTVVNGGVGLIRAGMDYAGCGALIVSGAPDISAT